MSPLSVVGWMKINEKAVTAWVLFAQSVGRNKGINRRNRGGDVSVDMKGVFVPRAGDLGKIPEYSTGAGPIGTRVNSAARGLGIRTKVNGGRGRRSRETLEACIDAVRCPST